MVSPAVRLLLGSTLDPDARDWANRVAAGGGSVSSSTKKAVSTFCKSAKASGYWTKLNRINLFAGDQLAAALVPLKVGGGGSTDTNVNFVSGDYSEATGLTGNGSTKYLNTGLTPSVSLTLNDTHLAVYNRAASATGAGVALGVLQSGGAANTRLYAPLTDGIAYSDLYNQSAGRVTSSVLAPYRLIVGSRTSATGHSIYQDGASKASNATSGGSLSTSPIFVFAYDAADAGGIAANFSSHPFAAYSIGSGLSAADVTAYNTHMQAFQTALGRNV